MTTANTAEIGFEEEIWKAAHTPEIGSKIDEAMRLIEKENRLISNIRDSLLPKLMSGKLRVNDIAY